MVVVVMHHIACVDAVVFAAGKVIAPEQPRAVVDQRAAILHPVGRLKDAFFLEEQLARSRISIRLR